MDTDSRHKTYPLETLLDHFEEEPYAYGFFQLLRMIECIYLDKPRMGTARRAADEPVRLCQETGMSFESSTISAFRKHGKGRPHHLLARFMGLLGPNGPLPIHLTEYALHRQIHHKDVTFARFLDVFHHRMLSFFYRAWAMTEPVVSFDRPQSDRFSMYVGSLAGFGMEAFRDRDVIPDHTKFYFAGRLASQVKNPDGLEMILAHYFQLDARIEEFVGEWIDLPDHQSFRLGMGAANGIVGQSLTLGRRIWSTQHKFRVVLGPMGLDDYRSLMPTGRRFRSLAALVRNYVGDELDWDLQLILAREEVPCADLSGNLQLGWQTWIGKRNRPDHASDLILNPRTNGARQASV